MSKALESYNSLPDHIKNGDLFTALSWARDMLHAREGEGFVFDVHAPDNDIHLAGNDVGDTGVFCAFSKHEWSGEHTGSIQLTGTKAVLMAVCEYIAEQSEQSFRTVVIQHKEELISQSSAPAEHYEELIKKGGDPEEISKAYDDMVADEAHFSIKFPGDAKNTVIAVKPTGEQPEGE